MKAGLVIAQIFSSRTVQVVLGAIIIIAIIYFLGKSSGKKKASKSIKNDLVAEVSNLTGQDVSNVTAITDRIKKDVYAFGASWLLTRDIEAYQLAMKLNDNQLRLMHNDWINRYFDVDQESIKVAISKENDYDPFSGFNKLRDSLVARLDQLGLN